MSGDVDNLWVAVGVTAVEESVVFKSQRQQSSTQQVQRPAPYASVAVLPGVELPPSVQATLQVEARPMTAEPAPVAPEPVVPAAVPVPVAAVSAVVTAPYVAGPVVEAQPAPAVPADWYPDPSGAYAHRWWDGTGWTEHTA